MPGVLLPWPPVGTSGRSISRVIGYAAVSLVAFGIGLGATYAIGAPGDETPAPRPAATSTTTEPPIVLEPPLALADASDDDVAAALIGLLPESALDVRVTPDAGIEVVDHRAFRTPAPLVLDEPFLPDAEGQPLALAEDEAVVVVLQLAEAPDDLLGLVVGVVFEDEGAPAEPAGPWAGATQVHAARLGEPDDVIGVASDGADFTRIQPLASARLDGTLLTLVFRPVAPFRIVVARGFDASLDQFGDEPLEVGEAIDGAQLDAIDDPAELVDLFS